MAERLKRTSMRYGAHQAQVADLWRPSNAAGPLRVVVLIHGGFWRQLYTKRLMQGLAEAVVDHGWAAYNVEYRRVGALGSGGWPHTFEDISAAVNALAETEGIDLDRVVTCGHSAGGHLALWAGTPRQTGTGTAPAHPVRPCAAISLAGVVDLVAAARAGVGGGAVEALMGGRPEDVPERYVLGSPAAQLPLGIPQTLIHGLDDATVPASLSRDYVDRAVMLGDDARYVPLPGAGHMEMIDPHGAALSEIALCLDRF